MLKFLGVFIFLGLTSLLARAREKDVQLEFSDVAISHIVERGYDPVYGARPLKRAITRLIANSLSEMYLVGELKNGATVSIGVEEEELSFTVG